MIKKYIVDEDLILKDYLKKIGIFSNVQKEIKKLNGQYLVNDQTVDNWYQLTKGDTLEIVFPVSIQGPNIKSIRGDFEILYEDSYFLIINKESNIASIPTKEHYDRSLANFVMSYYKIKGIVANIHFIGRLDYATSGIIALAKNPYILALMKQTPILKQYLLEVEGIIKSNDGIIEGGIEKDEKSIIKRKLSNNFINSKTTYKVLKRREDKTQVLATLHTGKTHQLRLHFASIKHPIIGDELYGNKTNDNILHLHSYYLEFEHPVNKKIVKIISTPKWFTL
ncbi:MAG: RluA family pseudouridine synthase [Staphylococcus sp.]|jgi:pseudouridylate synthase|nr:RluA family pseudouridine synthase [Staphylococcus sp.]